LVVRDGRHLWDGTQLDKFGTFSVKLMFWMQATGSGLRFLSSFLWCQMYRLGAISGTLATLQPVDFDARNSILGSYNLGNVRLGDDTFESEAIGGSIYDRAAFSSLFESFSREDDLDIEVRIIHHTL
jgi:hypothetical protein